MTPIERSSDDLFREAYDAFDLTEGGPKQKIEAVLAVARAYHEAEVKRLREALWECVKLTGADTSDGPPRPGTGDWPQLPELAVREVARLRAEHDEDEAFWAEME